MGGSAFFYSTGAVTALCQAARSVLTRYLLTRGNTLPSVLSIVCCILAYVVLAMYISVDKASALSGRSGDPATEPLLNDPESPPGVQPPSEEQDGRLASWIPSSISRLKFLSVDVAARSRNLSLLASIFPIAAISKATRPLFTTYIQRRYKLSSSQVSIASTIR